MFHTSRKYNLPMAPSSIDLFVGAGVLFVKSFFTKGNKLVLPQSIGEYHLQQQYEKADNTASLAVGVYTNGGKKFLVKRWEGKWRDLNYYFLLHEFHSAKVLSAHAARLEQVDIAVPAPVSCTQENDSLSVIFEFVEGASVARLSLDEQALVLERVLHVLDQISDQLTHDEKSVIGIRQPIFFVLVGTMFSVLAILANPKRIGLIFTTWRECVTGLMGLTQKKLALAHRDLTPDNLLKNQDTVYILDCETVALTLPGYDLAYLSVDSQNSQIFQLMGVERKAIVQRFLQQYIALHHILGSGSFLRTRSEYLEKLVELKKQ